MTEEKFASILAESGIKFEFNVATIGDRAAHIHWDTLVITQAKLAETIPMYRDDPEYAFKAAILYIKSRLGVK